MTRPMAVQTHMSMWCAVCEVTTRVPFDLVAAARCRNCGGRYGAPLEGFDWPNIGRALLAAVGMVAIVIVLTVVMPGSVHP